MKSLKADISKEIVEKALGNPISDADWREFIMDREEEWGEAAVKSACDIYLFSKNGILNEIAQLRAAINHAIAQDDAVEMREMLRTALADDHQSRPNPDAVYIQIEQDGGVWEFAAWRGDKQIVVGHRPSLSEAQSAVTEHLERDST